MRADRLAGIFFVALGAAALGFGFQIKELGLGQNQDPGPRVFPMVLGAILVVGGIVEFVLSLKKVPQGDSLQSGESVLKETPLSLAGLKNLGVLFVGLVLYVGLIGYLGFGLSTLLFGVAMMVRLGVRWWVAGLVTVGLLAGIYLLFGQLFRVQLPTGVLGLPFLGTECLNENRGGRQPLSFL